MSAAQDTVSPTRSNVLRLLRLPIFFVLPTAMPPLLDSWLLQHAGHFVSTSTQSRFLQIVAVVLVTASITWAVVAYISQRKSRTSDSNIDTLEESITKRTLERHDSGTYQDQWGIDHSTYLRSLQQEIQQKTEKPIYPWISPPQALPGPYDPMYYPLPAPSVRPKPLHSAPTGVEGRYSTSHTRLVPRAGTSFGEAVLYGTMTTSTKGWRRSHWNVTGG